VSEQAANPDHLLVRHFVEHASAPVRVQTNPVAADLCTTLQAWDALTRTLTLGFEPAERHVQGNRAVHGGVVTTMLDFGLAFCAMASMRIPKVAVTAALNVQFERPVLPQALVVRSTAHRVGSRLAFASAELCDADGQVLARANATLAVLG
jgi:uncharacterized protein (TIGR00369 family)